jgi:hypothetical protein
MAQGLVQQRQVEVGNVDDLERSVTAPGNVEPSATASPSAGRVSRR